MHSFRLLLLFFILFAFSGCKNVQKANVSDKIAGVKFSETAFLPDNTLKEKISKEDALKIRLAVNDIYCKDSACSCVHDVAARTYTDIQAGLKDKFNIELTLEYFMEPYDLEDRLVSGEVDGAICKPWLAFMLVPEHGMRYKRIADILDPKNKQFLTGIFIVKKDSPIKTISDLKGKSLVIGDCYSYEKHYLPLCMLNRLNISPAKTYTKASCIESVGELMDGKTDAAAISDYAMVADCAVDIAKAEDFRIIASTEEIPLTSVILDFRKISEADALRFREALLCLSGENAPKSMLGSGFILPAPWKPDTSVLLQKYVE